VDPELLRLRVAALRVAEVRVAAVDDRVVIVGDAEQLVERVLGDLSGGIIIQNARGASSWLFSSSSELAVRSATFGS